MQLTSSVAVVNGYTMHRVIAIRLGCCKYRTTNTFSSLVAILPFGRRHCQALIVHATDIILILLSIRRVVCSVGVRYPANKEVSCHCVSILSINSNVVLKLIARNIQ
eukprot:scaffold6541_cov120-Skeletonema_dohrnii-CCMP3373.AAC.2